jgi:hypothetical protein
MRALAGAAAVIAGVAIWQGDKQVIDYGVKGLGGVLLLLTAYFTARNLRQSARAAFLDRLMQAAQLLASQNEVQRTAGMHALQRLEAYTRDPDDKKAAREVREKGAMETDAPLPEPQA